MGISENIKRAMVSKGIKTGYMAERLGLQPQTISATLWRDSFTCKLAQSYADELNCELVLRDRETGDIY